MIIIFPCCAEPIHNNNTYDIELIFYEIKMYGHSTNA